MVASSDRSSAEAAGLAERLKDLRTGRKLTQEQLAAAFSSETPVRHTTISSWEKPGRDRLPPPDRLEAYARLFCTSRSRPSAGPPRLLGDGELTEQELLKKADLYDELLTLRERAQSADGVAADPQESSSLWRYPDGAAVSIVCSDAADPPKYASQDHLNYTSSARFADLDALLAIHGEIKAENPESDIKIMSLKDFDADDNDSHVVIIGGGAADDEAGRMLCRELILPTPEEKRYQVGAQELDSYIFRFTETDETFDATFDDNALTRDIGVFARGPHPSVRHLTVTVCSGITSRGVAGAALCFTDRPRKTTNEQYIKNHIGEAGAYCLVISVPVLRGKAVTPDLSLPSTIACYKQN